MTLSLPELLAGIFAFVIYIYFAIWLYRGLSRIKNKQPEYTSSGPQLGLSVIIAAHNEEGTIPNTLESLLQQKYPGDRFEIILLADRCTDHTAEIVRDFQKKIGNLRFFEIPAVPEAVSPKKYALQQGIQYARFRNLVMMDADCRVKPEYLQTFNLFFRNGTDVLINIPGMQRADSWLMHYILPERLLTWSIAAAAAGHEKPFLAFGTTWGYSREIYDKAGGLTPLLHSLSGDDDLLISRMEKAGARSNCCMLPEGWGETRVPETLSSFFVQRRRHHSAGRYYDRKPMLGYLFFHLSNFLLWLLPFFFLPFFILLLIKWLLDWFSLRRSANWFGERLRFRDFLTFEFGYILHHLLIAPLGMFGRIRWR